MQLLGNPAAAAARERLTKMTFREYVETGCVITGSAEQVVEEISRLSERGRIGHLMAICAFGSLPGDLVRYSLSILAEEVLPQIKKIWPESQWPNHWWPQRLGGIPLAEQLVAKVS